MNESHLPDVVGGYRVGRQLSPATYLGKITLPTTVVLAVCDDLPQSESRDALTRAIDVAMTPDGRRIAILEYEQTGEQPRFALETPPELAAAWDDMRDQVSGATYRGDDRVSGFRRNDGAERQAGGGLSARVAEIVARARKGPVMLAIVAGVIMVILALTLLPREVSPELPQQNGEPPNANARPNDVAGWTPPPVASGGSGDGDIAAASVMPSGLPTLVPQEIIGDIALVSLPTRDGAATGTPGEHMAVLERVGETWRLREVY